MQDARVRTALLIVCLACLLGSGIVLLSGRRAAPPPVVITPLPGEAVAAAPPDSSHPVSKPSSRIYVDVAGAVRRPSLYILPPESRVMQALLAAGGTTAEADLDAVNLAQKVTDGERVFVPKRRPVPILPQSTEGNTQSPAASARTAPKPAKGPDAGASNKITADSGEQIALNTATAADLQRLPSVGPSMAARILAYRQQAGGFQKIDELMEVTGIGPKKFAKIAPCVKLN